MTNIPESLKSVNVDPQIIRQVYKAPRIGANIPTGLRTRPQWVVWKYGKKKTNGKRAKVPFCPTTNKAASTADPATWATFDQALGAYNVGGYDGIGYVLTQDDQYTFIDLDDCIRNNELDAGAYATIKRFASYTERSVSGTGVHIIIEGAAPNRKNDIAEVYSNRRFIAITGDIVADERTIQARQTILDAWHAETFPPATEQPTPATQAQAGAVVIDDGALLDIIYESKQGQKFASLMVGNISGYINPETGKQDHSAADAALCAMLAFWTNSDPARMDRLFRQSGLMRPKWDRTGDGATNRTVGQLTIDNAIKQVRNGYRPYTGAGEVALLCEAWRAYFAGHPMHSATQRVLLAILRKFEQTNNRATHISSRNISDLTGLSHKATQWHLRLCCPQTRGARIKRLQADLNRVGAQLRAASLATTAEEMLLTIRPQERESILQKPKAQGEAGIMAEVMIYLSNRRDRAANELKFYATHTALDILDCTEAHDGSAFATVYTLRTLQNVSTVPMITVGGAQQHSDHDLCGNILQSSQCDALRFIEDNMNDDAFVVAPPAKLDPRLKLEADPVKRARLAKLLDVDSKLKPFGLAAPRVFAHLDGNPGADIDALTLATGVSERTIRAVLKATGPALVDDGYLPLIEATKEGRRHVYRLADDWRDRLDALRPDLATDGVVIARAVHHAGERIRRIDAFLQNGKRDSRRPLDDATKAQYEAIRQRAEQLKARILTGKTTVEDQPAALDVSNDLVAVEAQIERLTPATPAPMVATMPTPAPVERYYLGNPADPLYGHKELIGGVL